MTRARARQDLPATSHAAARSVGDLTEAQTAVMIVFRTFGWPMLDEDLIGHYAHYQTSLRLPRQSDSGLRTRRCELAKAGRLVEVGKGKMSTGRLGRTWGLPSRTQEAPE